MIELYGKRFETIYHLGYEDDEYVIRKVEMGGTVKWHVETMTYGRVQNNSKLGKKIINYISLHEFEEATEVRD